MSAQPGFPCVLVRATELACAGTASASSVNASRRAARLERFPSAYIVSMRHTVIDRAECRNSPAGSTRIPHRTDPGLRAPPQLGQRARWRPRYKRAGEAVKRVPLLNYAA